MLHFLSQLNHFPGRRKDRFIPLFLPEFDVEFAVGMAPHHESGGPFGFRCHSQDRFIQHTARKLKL